MRQLYVPVRWTAAVVAVMATAGCMSIGDDGRGEPGPARSAGERSAAAGPDGGSVTPGGGSAGGGDGDRGDGKGGKRGKGKGKGEGRDAEPGKSGSGAAQAASEPGDAGEPARPTKGGGSSPTRGEPDPPRPTPTPDPPKPTPTPTPQEPTPEPSSSAHEPPNQDAQLGERSQGLGSREPSPEAGPA